LRESSDEASVRLKLAHLLRKRGSTEEAIELLTLPVQEALAKRRLIELSLCFVDRGEILTATRILHANSMSTPPDSEDLTILLTLAGLHIRLGASLNAIACLRTLREAGARFEKTSRLLESEYRQLLLLRYGRSARALIAAFPRTGLTA
jgi:hypothetical protein